MRKLAIALALLCASSAYASPGSGSEHMGGYNPWRQGHKALAHPQPCGWHQRQGTKYRFLTCAGVEGPVSETIGEFGGVRDFKPWILITESYPDDAIPRMTVEVIPTGRDNSPQGELNPHEFTVTDIPVEWLPIGASVHDAYTLTDAGYRLLATFKK